MDLRSDFNRTAYGRFPPHLCPGLDLHFEVNQTSPHCGTERGARYKAVPASKLLGYFGRRHRAIIFGMNLHFFFYVLFSWPFFSFFLVFFSALTACALFVKINSPLLFRLMA